MWTIIPDNQKNYEELNPKRLGYTYLHGQLESDCGYDCYGFINCNLPVKSEESPYINDLIIENGKYPCIYQDKECILFFWHCAMKRPHGLVVYNTDLESVEYAEKQLKLKSINI